MGGGITSCMADNSPENNGGASGTSLMCWSVSCDTNVAACLLEAVSRIARLLMMTVCRKQPAQPIDTDKNASEAPMCE